ncbi:MAG: hypothetical protein LBH35_10195 [Treponema sp.]|jgi:hypothetical protein|nr:hypothetical protein [Treponema sp.]
MQVLIARTLNKILLLFTAAVVVLFAGIFVAGHYWPDYRAYYIGFFIFVSIVLAIYFKYIEDNWDKRLILRMAKNGKAALMEISGGRRIMPLRDTALKTYWIYEIEGRLWNKEHVPLKKTFQEKMNRDTEEIPRGFVYVTYDEQKPRQIFIIPNALIGNLPVLAPIVADYEKDGGIPIKYLDAYYNKGMILKTFRQTISDYKAEKK